jgi:hypothetical protein
VLAELSGEALERAPAGTMLHAAVTDEIALGDLAAAVSRLVGAGGRTEPLSLMEMYARGGGGGVSLSVNKRLASEKTRKILDWTPTRPQDTPFSIDELEWLLTDKLAKYEMPTEMEMGASPPKAPVKNWPKKELGARRRAALATVVSASGLTHRSPKQ